MEGDGSIRNNGGEKGGEGLSENVLETDRSGRANENTSEVSPVSMNCGLLGRTVNQRAVLFRLQSSCSSFRITSWV